MKREKKLRNSKYIINFRCEFNYPASTKEKIDALVFKEMYHTYKHEIQNRVGMKRQETIIQKPQLPSEQEVISKVEQILKERTMRILNNG